MRDTGTMQTGDNQVTLKKTAKLLKELKALRFDTLGPSPNYDFIENGVGAHIFEREGLICISGEDGLGIVDYYGEFSGGYPHIDKKLSAFAKERGLHWEWNDPSSIALTE
jgi:hypothetical protein